MATCPCSDIYDSLPCNHWSCHEQIRFRLQAVRFRSSSVPCRANYHDRASLQSTASAGNIAEEVISTVRTAHAFGTQGTLAALYEIPIQVARDANIRGGVWRGGSLAVFFFVIYSGYALGKHNGPQHSVDSVADCRFSSLQLRNHVDQPRPR